MMSQALLCNLGTIIKIFKRLLILSVQILSAQVFLAGTISYCNLLDLMGLMLLCPWKALTETLGQVGKVQKEQERLLGCLAASHT